MNIKNNNQKQYDLSQNIIENIESRETDISLLSLEAQHLAMTLRDRDKSDYFGELSTKISKAQSFINRHRGRMDEIYGTFTVQKEVVSRRMSELQKASLAWDNLMNTDDTPLDKKRRALKWYEEYEDEISNARSEIYQYALNTFYQIEFSEVSNNIFDNFRINMDKKLPDILPDAKNMLDSISVNIKSSNSEDWQNAITSCRRLLKEFANAVYPPMKNKKSNVKLDESAYVNRLTEYVKGKSGSKTYSTLIDTHLEFFHKRSMAVFDTTNKGTHKNISHEDAERFVIYTYLLIGDIISL